MRNEENLKKITRMEMQYDFDKKQKQQELEQQKKDLLKSAELNRQRFLKYIFSGSAIFLAIVFFILFRIKTRANRLLQKEIHDRKQAERELVKSMKLETVGILSAGITHDFNNLLTIIIGNLSMAQDSLEDNPPVPGPFLESANKASNQAAELVKNFLTLSEGGWAQKKQIELADIVKETMTAPEIKDIPLTVSLAPGLKPLFADDRQIRQVLVKLLVNAYEATTDINREREITLGAENTFLPADNSYTLKEGDYVYITIRDNGKGIPTELLDKIFDPYFSTKERGVQKGMGLSLAVCDSIIKRHKGHIFFTSEPGVGTTVHLYLPVNEELKG
jgi:two-component system cell cycle sensor histidine kinase/response regulator CckA